MTEFKVGDVVTEFNFGKPARISKIKSIKRTTILLENNVEYRTSGSQGGRFPTWSIKKAEKAHIEHIKSRNIAYALSKVDWASLPLSALERVMEIVKGGEKENE